MIVYNTFSTGKLNTYIKLELQEEELDIRNDLLTIHDKTTN